MKNISGAWGLRRSMDVGSPSHRETKWLRDRLEDAVTHRLGHSLSEPLLQGAVDVLAGWRHITTQSCLTASPLKTLLDHLNRLRERLYGWRPEVQGLLAASCHRAAMVPGRLPCQCRGVCHRKARP